MQRVQALLKGKDPVKWLFYGDSITHGALHTFGWRDYTEIFSERLRYEMGRGQDVVIKTAISGNSTRELLAQFAWRVEQFRPRVVLLMIGMNDCSASRRMPADEFRGNLVEMARRVEAFGGLTVMQTTCPILPGQAPDREPSFDGFMAQIREAASERGLPLVDHTAHWRAHASWPYWMSNAFHPNEYGHRAFARLLFRELGIEDPASACCRLFVP